MFCGDIDFDLKNTGFKLIAELGYYSFQWERGPKMRKIC